MPSLSDSAIQTLRSAYFVGADTATFMLLDGAANPAIIDHLYDDETDFSCLFTGELEPDVRETAPYLVELKAGEPFADWVIEHGFGNHWGIVLRSTLSRPQLLRRFRQVLVVRDEAGDPLFFRFYDPRVLRDFLPSCQDDELWRWFDNIDHYLVEGNEPGLLLRLSAPEERIRCEEIRL